MKSRDDGRIGYLDGMRGIAALMVFAIHANGLGLRSLGIVGNSIADNLIFGVVIFFVLSGYSISIALDRHPGVVSFFVRRFFRIYPLYALVCVAAVVSYQPSNVSSLLAHLTFWNILDLRYAADLLSVEWTIPVEVSFYVLAPAIFALTLRRWPLAAAVAVVLAVPQVRQLIAVGLGDYVFAHRNHTLIWHLYAFLFGVVAYRFRPKIHAGLLLAAGSAMLVLVMAFPSNSLTASIMAAATVLLIWACGNGSLIAQWLRSAPMIWLGHVSYSIYLTHTFVLHWLKEIPDVTLRGWVALPAVLTISWLTQRFIEAPFIDAGRKLARRTPLCDEKVSRE